MRYKPKTIEEQGGIQVKLDAEAEKHNGFDWHDFDVFANLHETGKLPLTAIKSLMGMKSTQAVKTWLDKRQKLKQQ